MVTVLENNLLGVMGLSGAISFSLKNSPEAVGAHRVPSSSSTAFG